MFDQKKLSASGEAGVAPCSPSTEPDVHAGSPTLDDPSSERLPVRNKWIALFATTWLGVWIAQNAPVQFLLPEQISTIYVGESANFTFMAYGATVGFAGVISLLVYPVIGTLSDRTTSRFGRRRPWILGGSVVMAVGLILLGLQSGIVGIAATWTLVAIGFCSMTAGLSALLSDRVPENQLGAVAAWIPIQQGLGAVLGLVVVGTVLATRFGAYVALAGIVLAFTVPLVMFIADPSVRGEDFASGATRVRTGRRRPSRSNDSDFRWTVVQVLLLNLGSALGLGLLLYYLEFGVGIADPAETLTLLSIVYVVTVSVGSLISSRLSDRLGRRRVFVLVGALAQAAATVLICLGSDLGTMVVSSVVLGVGYGMYTPALQAQATLTLPDPDTRGEDMSLVYATITGSAALAPIIGALIVVYLGGFTVLFGMSAALSGLGALVSSRIKGVR
ncbi:MFS transporter [Rhodococcus sp. IEGM1428]|uniref:MFS transporter n=1 Tax=Rhodococcus sp. IEGM1428 TaxID=3392191 RepID=UPI003D1162D5